MSSFHFFFLSRFPETLRMHFLKGLFSQLEKATCRQSYLASSVLFFFMAERGGHFVHTHFIEGIRNLTSTTLCVEYIKILDIKVAQRK